MSISWLLAVGGDRGLQGQAERTVGRNVEPAVPGGRSPSRGGAGAQRLLFEVERIESIESLDSLGHSPLTTHPLRVSVLAYHATDFLKYAGEMRLTRRRSATAAPTLGSNRTFSLPGKRSP